MDPQANGGSSSNDRTMSTPIDDASMHTITASSLQQQQPGSGLSQYEPRPQTSYSDTGFSRPYSQSADNTPDGHMQNGNGLSRPPSTQSQGQQYGGQQGQPAQKNASVVIKVGMVGDAQIGKTSLMVKYVEGSWDEDYIQTLGEAGTSGSLGASFLLMRSRRRQLHGEDN